MHDGAAHQHRLGNAVAHQRDEARAFGRPAFQHARKGVAIFEEILDTDSLVAKKQPAGRLVRQLDLAVGLDDQECGRRIVKHRLVETVGVGQAMLLVAHPLQGLVEHLAQLPEAAAFEPVGKTLAEIGETDRVDEPGQLDIGPPHMAPEHDRRPDDSEARDDPCRAEIVGAERLGEDEAGQKDEGEAPGEADQEPALEAGHEGDP